MSRPILIGNFILIHFDAKYQHSCIILKVDSRTKYLSKNMGGSLFWVRLSQKRADTQVRPLLWLFITLFGFFLDSLTQKSGSNIF